MFSFILFRKLIFCYPLQEETIFRRWILRIGRVAKLISYWHFLEGRKNEQQAQWRYNFGLGWIVNMVVIRGLLRARQFIMAPARQSRAKVKCIAHERSECRQGIYSLARINCRALSKPPYNFPYIIRRAINRNLLDSKILFIYAACYKVQ